MLRDPRTDPPAMSPDRAARARVPALPRASARTATSPADSIRRAPWRAGARRPTASPAPSPDSNRTAPAPGGAAPLPEAAATRGTPHRCRARPRTARPADSALRASSLLRDALIESRRDLGSVIARVDGFGTEGAAQLERIQRALDGGTDDLGLAAIEREEADSDGDGGVDNGRSLLVVVVSLTVPVSARIEPASRHVAEAPEGDTVCPRSAGFGAAGSRRRGVASRTVAGDEPTSSAVLHRRARGFSPTVLHPRGLATTLLAGGRGSASSGRPAEQRSAVGARRRAGLGPWAGG